MMNYQRTESSRNRVWWLAVSVIVLAYAVRVWAAYYIPLFDTTEARYADMARKMVESSDWINVPYDGEVDFWSKPPSSFWISALGVKLFGDGELSSRIGLLLVSLMFLWGWYAWVRKILGAHLSVMATLALAISPAYLISSAVIFTDMMLTIAISIALMGFWNRINYANPKAEWFLYLGMAMGLLSKGPIALLFILFPIGIWAFVNGKIRQVWRDFQWIKGGIMVLLIAIPWYVLFEIKSPGFLHYFIMKEHLGRFFAGDSLNQGYLFGSIHKRPLGTIWAALFIGCLPFSLLAIGLVFKRSTLDLYRNHRSLINFLLWWMLGPLLLFSFTRHILESYALPAVPPFIMLITMLIMNARPKQQITRSYWVMALSLGIIVPFILSSVYFTRESYQNPKLTKKQLISYITQGEFLDCPLFIWKDRSFSAEYYSQGATKTARNFDALQAAAKAKTCALLVINKKLETSFPADKREKIRIVKKYPTITLYILSDKADYPPPK